MTGAVASGILRCDECLSTIFCGVREADVSRFARGLRIDFDLGPNSSLTIVFISIKLGPWATPFARAPASRCPVCIMSFHWFVLLVAIAVELVATVALKAAVGASGAVAWTPLLLIGLSISLLGIALRVIPMAVAYAVWEGLGIIGIAAAGHFMFGEALTPGRVAGLAAILAGILLLEYGSSGDAAADEGRPS